MARRPVRTADAERSRSSVEGGVGNTSSSVTIRRSRLRAGAFLIGTAGARRRAAAFLATGRWELRDTLTAFGALRAAVFLATLPPTVFRAAAFLLTARFGAAARGATRFFTDFLLLAALRVAAVRLAAAVVVFRAVVFFATFF